MRAIYSLQSAWFKFDTTTPSPRPSYSNRIFQEPFSITTTVLTKPFPHVKCMRTDFFLLLQWRQLRKSHTWNFALLFWKRVTLPPVWKTLGSHCHFLRDSTKPRHNYVQLPFRFCSISFSPDSLSFIGPISVERQTGGSNVGTAVNAILIKRRRISQ